MFVSLSLSRMRDIDAPARLASVWSQPSSTRVLLAILGRLTMSGGTSVARSLLRIPATEAWKLRKAEAMDCIG